MHTRTRWPLMLALSLTACGAAEDQVATRPTYLWNQNLLQAGGSTKRVSTSNLTPAWAEFELPPVL